MAGRTRQTRFSIGSMLAAGCAAAALAALAGCGSGHASAAATAHPAAHRAAASAPAAHGAANVLTAPTLIARTSAGTVAYREVGTGSPLLLIMGLGASMDGWTPSFVNALAAEHEVVVFDNSGVGRTAVAARPLTISAMADQTSALISALRLGRPAVLGWSMGGMVAQALAVRHPAQVSRLILAATQPGTGKALPIPPAAAAAAVSPNPATVLTVLFPPDQVTAAQAYVAGILRYPGFYQAPQAIKISQGLTIQQWLAGQDPAGRQAGALRLPALVADGTADALNPVANDRLLAGAIPGATLTLYPQAGHAFLFQDAATFIPAVERFLG